MASVNSQLGSDQISYNKAISTTRTTDEDALKKEAFVDIQDVDLVAYYEEAAGRLVVDPQYVFRYGISERPTI